MILAFLRNEIRPVCHLRDHPAFMTFAERIGLKAARDAHGYRDCWHRAALPSDLHPCRAAILNERQVLDTPIDVLNGDN